MREKYYSLVATEQSEYVAEYIKNLAWLLTGKKMLWTSASNCIHAFGVEPANLYRKSANQKGLEGTR